MEFNRVKYYNSKPQESDYKYRNNKLYNPIIEQYSNSLNEYKIGGMVLATALAAATISGSIVHGKMNRRLKPLNRQINNLRKEIINLGELNRTLKEQTRKIKAKFEEVFTDDFLPEQIQAKLKHNLTSSVNSFELSYDPMTPPVTGKRIRVYEDAIDLPPRKSTTNRSEIKQLDIPEIRVDGSFEYLIPKTSAIRTTQVDSIDFTPRINHLTNISEGYADSVAWNNDKIARDILQNFFDGHGQTLDGVRIKFTPTVDGKYKIRIEGDSQYTADKAIFIGESTKRDYAHAAGNYGEGLKIASLKLLKDKGADCVKVGSDNWNLTFKLAKDDISSKRVMAFDLDKVPKQNGNFIEFKTNDKKLLYTIRTSINRFYHSGNTDFRCPDFENDKMGIKLLKQKRPVQGDFRLEYGDAEKGCIYIAGQRYEFDGSFDGLQGGIIFIKECPPKSVLDPSRDRTSLNKSDLEKIMGWVYESMSKEEKMNFINIMEPLWKQMDYNEKTPIKIMFETFLRKIKYDCNDIIHINFPKERYVAYSMASNDVVRNLESKSYLVCDSGFSELGMQTISELIGNARAHEVVDPNAKEIKKIKILKEMLKKLSLNLEGKHFTPEELDTKIYLFDKNSKAEKKMYGNVRAEAITDFGTSKGFWIDRTYLREGSFGEILETALHELSHKAGGDESVEFSYKLTDVNKEVLKQLNDDPETRSTMNILNKLWKET